MKHDDPTASLNGGAAPSIDDAADSRGQGVTQAGTEPPRRLAGAARAAAFAEPAFIQTPPVPAEQPPPPPAAPEDDGWQRFQAPMAGEPQHRSGPAPGYPATDQERGFGQPPVVPMSWTPPPPKERPAEWSSGRTRALKVLSLGTAKPKASAAELEDRHLRRLIREITWPRSVSIGVVNEKGGSGKTPLALCLAGTLASIRGGSVAAYDAARSRNGLDLICEGRPARCISELAANPDLYATPGKMAAFAARQTSFADVICSLRERAFDDESIRRVRFAIDACYAISVADSGNAHEDSAYRAITHGSDLLAIPVAPSSVQSVDFGMKLIRVLRNDPAWRPVPFIVVLMHGGGKEIEGSREQLLGLFQNLGVAATLEIPYDSAVAGGRRITLGNLTHASSVAWTQVAAAAVSNITVN